MCSIFFVDNNSCDNKTQWILVFLDQILLSIQSFDEFS